MSSRDPSEASCVLTHVEGYSFARSEPRVILHGMNADEELISLKMRVYILAHVDPINKNVEDPDDLENAKKNHASSTKLLIKGGVVMIEIRNKECASTQGCV